jgi:hypothetical protein
MLNDSQIPAPRVPITEKEGGLITREWFRFFNFVYEQIVRLTSFAYGSFSGFETTTWAAGVTTRVSITDTALSSGVSVASSQVTVANAGLYSVNASFQLYNLKSDPGETQNLVAQNADRVATMKAALETAIAQGRTTPGPDQANDTQITLVKPTPTVKAKAKAKTSR